MEIQQLTDIPEGAGSTGPRPPESVGPETLTCSQLHSLFDILTHHETYAEVESFKDPRTISEYGYPFTRHSQGSDGGPEYSKDSSAPLLAGVLRSIVLSLPGVRDLPPEFWHVRFQGILEKLAAAELSESYDKGVLGTRKTLATAASVLHEAVSRGVLGGTENGAKRNLQGKHDQSKAQDLARAWEDVVHELVYGNLVDELFTCTSERQSLEEHSPGVQAVVDYIIIHLATMMHQVFNRSAEGPYLLKLLENVHKLLPYSMVRQTLRIGNAATMLNGMIRLLLAKMGVGALSNWIGLKQNADDGMNLLQRIISLVLSWDSFDFRKSADAIEKAKGGAGPSKEQLAAIKEYLEKPRREHDETRLASIKTSKSMVATILERSSPDILASVSETQHTQCLDYFSALLAARDRDEITNVLCRQSPDLFTQAIKDAVASFEPFIRAIHERVDLREHVSAAEGFLTEFINISKANKSTGGFLGSFSNGARNRDIAEPPAPSVEAYVILLRRNRHLLYNWIHQVASQCPNVREDFCAWAKETIKVFRISGRSPSQPAAALLETPDNYQSKPTETDNVVIKIERRRGAAGALSDHLQHLFASLAPEVRSRVLPALDAHASHLSSLEDLSLARMQRILDNLDTLSHESGKSGPAYAEAKIKDGASMSFSGPGMFLSRWQQLLDDTLIGPALPEGPLRRGRDVKGRLAQGKTVAGAGAKDGWDPASLPRIEEEEEEEEPRPPDVGVVIEALGGGFRELVRALLERE
ncbi:hypothetical protein VTK56DRAFT_5317 [Thermocarpiscus australiensis]